MDYSKLLISPNKDEFFLDDEEIKLLKEARFSFMEKDYSKTLSFVWDAIISNLIRRISTYGPETFLHNLSIEDKNIYLKQDIKSTQSLDLLNNTILIKNCLKLNIIDAKTFTILDFFYTFLKNSNIASLKAEEINSCLILLEINLFKIPIEKAGQKDLANDIRKIDDDYSSIQKKELKSKNLKKEDILLMHYVNNVDKELHPIITSNDIPRRRKEDKEQETPTTNISREDKKFFYRRRKEDRAQAYSSVNIPVEETKSKKFFHRRRKDDFRRRKDDI